MCPPWQPTISEDYPCAGSAWSGSLTEVDAILNISWSHGYPTSYLAWLGSDGRDMKACKFVVDILHLIVSISSVYIAWLGIDVHDLDACKFVVDISHLITCIFSAFLAWLATNVHDLNACIFLSNIVMDSVHLISFLFGPIWLDHVLMSSF